MAPIELSSHFHTTAGGTKIHYLQGGNPDGQLLIGLHGLGGSTNTFAPLLPYLPASYNITLVDFPGFGKSPFVPKAEPVSVDGYVADLYDLITSLQAAAGSAAGKGKVIILGHSLGGIVTLQYAARHASTVAGAGVLGVGRAPGGNAIAVQRMRDLAANARANGIASSAANAAVSNFPADTAERTADPAHRAAVRAEVAAADQEAYAQTAEALVADSHVDPDYAQIACPLLFVAGDLDLVSPVQRSRDLSELVAGDSWVEVVRSGHQPILQETEAVAKAVNTLLEKVAASA